MQACTGLRQLQHVSLLGCDDSMSAPSFMLELATKLPALVSLELDSLHLQPLLQVLHVHASFD